MQVIDLMVMMMILRVLVVLVIVRAQFKEM